MKRTNIKTILFILFVMHSLGAFSQTEDFFSFIIRFSSDSAFQYSRVMYPLEIISWDYDEDVETSIKIWEKDYSQITLLNLNSECSDGFMYVSPNVPMEVNEMILEIKGLTDASDKYWFAVIEGKWYLVKYRNYDFGG